MKRLVTVCGTLLGVVFILLTGCHVVRPTDQTSMEQSITTLQEASRLNKNLYPRKIPNYYPRPKIPANVNSSILPPLSHYVNPSKDKEPTFDVNANKVPAKEFFTGLVTGTSTNMVVNPNVTGDVTLSLKNVTIHQAMDAVRDMYGYEYQRTSYGYEVQQPEIQTRLFHINYLDVQRTGRSYIQLTTGQVSNKVGTTITGGSNTASIISPSGSNTAAGGGAISTIETKTEMRFWNDIEKAVTGMLLKDDGHTVTVNPLTGIIAVRAFPLELKRVNNFFDRLQASLNRQVIIEAKILEVQLNDTFNAGIDWSILGVPGTNTAGIGQTGHRSFDQLDFDSFNSIFAFQIKGNFKLLIDLLQTQGNVQVLSSPHISTINNQKAVIKVGSDEFFVTGVTTTQNIIANSATTPSQDVSLTPFFSGITLDVTPEISNDDTVILHIHPSVSKVTEQSKTIQLGNTAGLAGGSANTFVLPLAFSTIRESDNIVRVRNGQIIVIGGLMTNNTQELIAATPFASKIPFLGSLFRRTEQKASKSELVILLRPIVANNKNYTKFIEAKEKSFQMLKRPFHAGGLPKVFGNEAEREDRN